MESQIIEAATKIIQPVLESGMIIAGYYTKACNRKTITAKDVQYGMMYSARNLVGKNSGSLFPEDSDESEDEDESDIEEVEEDDEPFTKYSGDDELMNKVNEAVETWKDWVPYSPVERMLKDSVDKSY